MLKFLKERRRRRFWRNYRELRQLTYSQLQQVKFDRNWPYLRHL